MKLVGERKAIASAVFALYFLLFLSNALLGGGPTAPAFYALAGCYGLAFFSVVAGYFWARWYAIGIGVFGIIVAVVATWQMGGYEPTLAFFGGTHLAAVLSLWGERMSEPFEGQAAWREKFHMDDNAVQRLGRSVMRAGVSLPFVLLYGLVPRQGSGADLVAVIAAGLAVAGFAALVKLRTWGVLAIGAAGLVVVAHGSLHPGAAIVGPYHQTAPLAVVPVLALGALLVAAAVPFGAAMRRWIAAR